MASAAASPSAVRRAVVLPRELPLVYQVFFDLAGHRREALFDTDVVLGRSLQIGNAIIACELLGLLGGDLSFIRQVALVSDQDNAHVFVGEPLDLMHPLLHIIKGLAVGHVVHDDDAVGSTVVACCERAEAFLAGCVPNLELNILSVHLDVLDFEVHAYGVEEVLVERIFGVPDEEATLADSTVADQQHFEEEVATVVG
eukprot:CAMPEP_0170481290 /NCGR_PEP_ID=MMETSP0208-20121228/1788_1 /TAXON_ID=197538 /ORGANISM="Strombidium inclinatum, Strain S3" /LENGTH=198 /DNA_ID=CAMNT_0010753963 /DNA_START=52 /DNA_END=649 /DNA_ORIENTATION=-